MFSSIAQLTLGQQSITMQHRQDIIDGKFSKSDHDLCQIDINPKDKQNYCACERMVFGDVLSILKQNNIMQATYVCL